jgi:uroporphyrinogen-III synthase
MRLLLTRPDTGADDDPLAAALLAAGHEVLRAPLLAVVPTGAVPEFGDAQAIIVTSRNGLRNIGGAPFSDAARALPLFAVGPATAALGRALGFSHVIEGTGGAQALAALISAEASPTAGPLIQLSGAEAAFDLEGSLKGRGFDVRRTIVYRTEPATRLPPEVGEALQAGHVDGVMLMSPRTAIVYANLMRDAGLETQARQLAHFCLSEAVARNLAALDPVRTAVARSPNSQEMLALIAREAPDSR